MPTKLKTPKEEKLDVINDELKKFSKLEAFYLSDGGKLLFKSLMADAVSCIETLGNKYNTLTPQEFIGLCAEMKTKIDLARVMKKSVKNKKQAQEDLQDALLDEE